MTGDKLADALRAARTWLEADKWRYSTNEKHASWEALMRGIDKAAHSAQGVGNGWEYEFEIEQDGEFVAGGTTSTPDAALSEATHYEAMYGQDGGPVIARFWRKQPISRDALAAPTKETP